MMTRVTSFNFPSTSKQDPQKAIYNNVVGPIRGTFTLSSETAVICGTRKPIHLQLDFTTNNTDSLVEERKNIYETTRHLSLSSGQILSKVSKVLQTAI